MIEIQGESLDFMDANLFQAAEGLNGPLYLWLLWFSSNTGNMAAGIRRRSRGAAVESKPRLEMIHNIFQKHLWL